MLEPSHDDTGFPLAPQNLCRAMQRLEAFAEHHLIYLCRRVHQDLATQVEWQPCISQHSSMGPHYNDSAGTMQRSMFSPELSGCAGGLF